jgi:2-dehydropantoate 2-reductase
VKIAVLGAGAVGLSVAAKLSRHCDVHAVCRPEHANVIRERGFVMTGIWGDGTYRFSAGEELPPGAEFDYYIITAKSIATRTICEQFAGAVAGQEVVSLQNGIGNEEIIAGFTDRVIGGMTITGFEWRGDGAVHVSVEAGPTKLGRFPEGTDPAVAALAALFNRAGINTEATDVIRSDLWGKTIYNCSLNPLGAIMDVSYGKLADPAAWRIIEEIVSEAFSVCTAEGVRLPWETAAGYLGHLRDLQLPATAQHHSSMLQDVSRGRKTEIDFLNGAVVTKGREHGIATPVNRTISNLIRFRESLSGKR